MTSETKKENSVFANYLIWLGVGLIDYSNSGAIYLGYLTPALMAVFKQTLQYIFFPIYAVNTFIYAGLSLHYLLIDREKGTGKFKKENIVRLAVNCLSVALVTSAVVMSLAFSATVGIASSVLFALNLAVTAVFNFTGAGYHLYHFRQKSKQLVNPMLTAEEKSKLTEERLAHRNSAISYTAVGVTIALCALAGVLAVMGGFLPLAAFGVAAGAIGLGFCIYGLVKLIRERRAKKAEQAILQAAVQGAQPDSTVTLGQTFGLQVQNEKTSENLVDTSPQYWSPLMFRKRPGSGDTLPLLSADELERFERERVQREELAEQQELQQMQERTNLRLSTN